MNKAAQELGRRGGQAKSEAKAEAARENGRKGGRPKKKKPPYPQPGPFLERGIWKKGGIGE